MRDSDTTATSNTPDPTPPTHDASPVSFDAAETRADRMRATIESWLGELSDLVDAAWASDRFRAWLDAQSQFHDYSYRNTLLIMQQCPEATKVAGYRTWQQSFDRQVREGESAIWIWAPLIAKRCPACEHAVSYHEASDCDYDQTPPDAWSKGLVGFKPVPVFDVSQTEGEPLPELETAASGDGEALLEDLLAAAADLAVDVQVVPDEAWRHGAADGIYRPAAGSTDRPTVEVRDRPDAAAIAGTLVHELAHARLHADGDGDEREKREVEAEAVAYVVGRHFGLDTSNSAFYLAAWQGEGASLIAERLDRIATAASELIEIVEAR